METTVRYSDVITLTSTSGSLAKYIFSLNSCYDPDVSGTGHQPLMWDQLTALYNRYVVKGAKIKCQFSPISNTTSTTQPSGPMVIGIMGDADNTTPTTGSTIMESNKSASTFLNNAQGGNNVKTISHTYSPSLRLGVDPEDDTVSAPWNSSPGRQYYAHVFMFESGLGSPSSCNVKVDIEFRVRLYSTKDVSGS